MTCSEGGPLKSSCCALYVGLRNPPVGSPVVGRGSAGAHLAHLVHQVTFHSEELSKGRIQRDICFHFRQKSSIALYMLVVFDTIFEMLRHA